MTNQKLTTLNDHQKYYEHHQPADYLFMVVFVLALLIFRRLFVPIGLGIIYLIYTKINAKVLVSQIDTRYDKFWVSRNEWRRYCKANHISAFIQYNPDMIANKKI